MTVSLEKVGEGQFKAVAPTGAPFEMVLPLTITNGSISGSATSATITVGSVESGTLTVIRTPGTTAAVTVNIGTLSRRPSDHSGYYFVKPATLPLVFTELGGAEFTPVSERTPQVRDAIVAAVPGINSATEVTVAHLMAITHLYSLKNQSITSLKEGDLDGLTSLTDLDLRENDLTTLPAGVFKDLTSLTSLGLQDNDLKTLPLGTFGGLTSLTFLGLSNNALTTLPTGIFKDLISLQRLWLIHNNTLAKLPAGIFDGLTSLEWLSLQYNALTTLPAGIFNDLTSLTKLDLNDNTLTTLPVGIFNGLTAVTSIDMIHNELTSLPDGLFKGLTALNLFRLGSSVVAPLPLTVSLEKVADGQFKAVAPTGAPFDIVLPISVTNGSITGGSTTITIPVGSIESGSLTVTRTPSATAAVTVNIGTLPGLASNHYGYSLAKSTDLPLEVISAEPTVVAPQVTGINIPDAKLRTKIETALGKTSGDPISAAEMATLTSLNSQNARISNLTGLETATNLTTLKLGNNAISNISALSGLTSLTELQLWDNQLSNISALAGLTNLTRLYLWGNSISDISHLSGLTNLRQLRIGENNISNIDAVANLTNLTHLNLNENVITGISAVAGLTGLTELRIGDNTISDISAVQNLTNLVWLDMPNNRISDLSAVQNLTSLGELYFQNNEVSDLSPLVANTGIGEFTELDASGNPLSYPSIYTHIPALQARNVYIDFDNRVATTPVKISGDTQQGNTNTTLAQPFVVEVRDGRSVAFAGVPVTFAVTAGGGTLGATNATTDANGRAESRLTLGNTAGTNTVRASVQGISQTVTFTAKATTTNIAPVFTEGVSTTRTIAENTAASINIGAPIAATDANNDTLTYTLTGTDAISFSIVSISGQLQTRSALDYETKTTYSVMVTVTDGSLSNTITVTISVTNIADDEQPGGTTYASGEDIPKLPTGFWVADEITGAAFSFSGGSTIIAFNQGGKIVEDGNTYTCVSDGGCRIENRRVTKGAIQVAAGESDETPIPTNTAPTFTEGASTTRPIAENTAAGINIGAPIAATDANNDTLTYTLTGTDAISFSIVSISGQLQTRSALDYETKTTYSVMVTVTDGSLSNTITVAISVTNIDETSTAATTVNIPDANLRAKIETALVKTSGDPISPTEMETLTSLNAQDARISDLTGLETATNLITLKLGDNSVSDLSPLTGLTKLTELQLWDNSISNLSALTGLTNLTRLYLWGNTISDISHLSRLINLTQLRIGENSISNIAAVSNLTNLTYLSVKENSISNISAVSRLTNLTQLQIGNNTISDITPVQNLTNLEWLDVPNNSISDISAVQNLTQLVELYFQNNAVSDLSPLVANTGLGADDELDMRGNPLSYSSIYTHIPALQARNAYVDFDNRVVTAPVKISGDTQQGDTGTALAQPFIVEVRDTSRVAFAEAPVTFAVTEGGGTLSATNITTDANGRAESTLTLGSTAGKNAARVSVTGITHTVTFTATATTVVVSVSPIINRTPQVRDAIVAALPGINSANDVTDAHLATITSLNLTDKSIISLKADDFDGLSSLKTLYLNDNQLDDPACRRVLRTIVTDKSLPESKSTDELA